MIQVDGSAHSGSGTLLRYAVALATLLGEPLHMTRIRAKREKPGLRPQHLQAVRACCSLSDGELEGAEVGSTEIIFKPGHTLKTGDFRWDIGTAGSTTMLAFTLIPLALFASRPCSFSMVGGLFQDFAPSAFHLQMVLLPVLKRMGVEIRMEVLQPGYPPKGEGRLRVEVKPLRGGLKPLRMTEQGSIKGIRGISLASHLENERVSERMADQCKRLLEKRGYQAHIEVLNDQTALQKGAALLLWAETETGCLLGSDQAGKPGRRSEKIAHSVVASLFEDLDTKATTDRHLADQLILFAALAGGTSEYLISRMTEHIESNLWLVEKILGVKSELSKNHLRIQGIGFQKTGKEI
ncbi:MAG: RNA 3'-terminal phosphate cyclase [Thermodesulfobacteriota bacterium]|jgi:RNA 3'-terminal phosphate cyclase (ATP)